MGERDIGARSDVYALGAMTYEMLTGEPPFTGPTPQAIVAKVLTETPPPLRPKRPTVPPAVEHAVLTALQKLPADRYGTRRRTSPTPSTGRGATPQRWHSPARAFRALRAFRAPSSLAASALIAHRRGRSQAGSCTARRPRTRSPLHHVPPAGGGARRHPRLIASPFSRRVPPRVRRAGTGRIPAVAPQPEPAAGRADARHQSRDDSLLLP